ncbi:MAG: penicillin-binding protein 2 [Actinomycetota bacterium]|nr:penicillin-binding protein 2 [Actinomycetota bacterium]
MSEQSRLRLVVLRVLVLSLLVTLFARLWFLQVVAGEDYSQAAADNRIREVVTPAVRGQILDDAGRPLARNRTAMVVSVSRTELLRQRDGGEALLRRLASVLRMPYAEVRGRTRLCGTPGAPKPPTCWNGSPYQPIPVTDEARESMALQIVERGEDFPGVTAELRGVREYPLPQRANAAHLLGYLGPVTQAELDADQRRGARTTGLGRADAVGRAGLEKQYDAYLRGRPGVRRLSVDHRGGVTGTVGETEPVAGSHLVTHLDAKVQAVAERELREAIHRARTQGDINKNGKRFKADSGAVVVLDVQTGGVVAMASWPTYDPNVWVGGITTKEYRALTSKRRNVPTISRAFQGEYAPASTFKAVTLPAAVKAGYSVDASYPCPSAYKIGNSRKRNYESQGFGTISMERALEVSCDTVFYKFAYETWRRMGGTNAPVDAKDPFHRTASGFGLGRRTGIDLPGERDGRIPDRRWKRAYWKATRGYYCAKARTGFPDVARTDPARARYLRQLSRENCIDGFEYRGGDAANFAIGQGDVLVTPLQMARVYAAIANGGRLWVPQVAKAVLGADGTVVKRFRPRSTGKAPVDGHTMAFLRRALTEVTREGTGRGPFARAGFPLDAVSVASKTGTGEVYGKQTTSWFASYAPADQPRYAVVMMVSQGGTGSGTSGPGVADIYKSLFGVRGQRVDPRLAAQPGGRPPAAVPVVRRDGTVGAPPRGRRR